MIRATFLVSGAVQAVGYRAFVCTVAHNMHINGKVKNLETGDVEIIGEFGGESDLEKFHKFISRKDGRIKVNKVEIKEKINVDKPKFTWFFVDS